MSAVVLVCSLPAVLLFPLIGKLNFNFLHLGAKMVIKLPYDISYYTIQGSDGGGGGGEL